MIICVHGAALGNVVFLPHKAVVVHVTMQPANDNKGLGVGYTDVLVRQCA